jgi:hypothetical protein
MESPIEEGEDGGQRTWRGDFVCKKVPKRKRLGGKKVFMITFLPKKRLKL